MGRFLRGLARGRMFGHPVHAMLVHFPSALYPASLALDFAALVFKEQSFAAGASYCLAIGILGGGTAALFGAIDYFRLPSSHPAWNKASLHALLNVVWLMLFATVFGMRMEQYPHFQTATVVQLTLSALGTAGLLFSNFLGGELVFRHRLGMMEEERPKGK